MESISFALGATTLAQATGVHATIGTPPGPLRKQSCLLWRLGTAFLLEEALNADAVKLMYRLGAQYSSSYQTPSFGASTTVSPPLLSEERLAFGVSALAVYVAVSFLSLQFTAKSMLL